MSYQPRSRVVVWLVAALSCTTMLLCASSASAELIDFESPTYSTGDLFGQDGWTWTYDTGTLTVTADVDGQYVDGNGAVFGRRQVGPFTSGTVDLTMDARLVAIASSSTMGYFYVGDNRLFTDENPQAGGAAAANFGFSADEFFVRNGTPNESEPYPTASLGTWYTFEAAMYLTDPDGVGPKAASTYDMVIRERGETASLLTYSDVPFRDVTVTEITRFCPLVGNDMQMDFDNINLVPEPGTLLLLAVGGLVLCVWRTRRFI